MALVQTSDKVTLSLYYDVNLGLENCKRDYEFISTEQRKCPWENQWLNEGQRKRNLE
jgi:hypothetical protein